MRISGLIPCRYPGLAHGQGEIMGSDPANVLLLKGNCFEKPRFQLLKTTFEGQKQHFKVHMGSGLA